MGLFVERVPTDAAVEGAITKILKADPSDANDPAKVAVHVAAAKQAAQGPATYKWTRIAIGLLVGGALLAVGIMLMLVADNWAVDQALRAATIPGYAAPTSSLPELATSIVALGSAWSGALVGVVLSEKTAA